MTMSQDSWGGRVLQLTFATELAQLGCLGFSVCAGGWWMHHDCQQDLSTHTWCVAMQQHTALARPVLPLHIIYW